eukprot:NODE_1_length_95616_cov_0.657642.p15 type:complete len:403 gc:universal NODE_1_length_95616_cov_0.657642:90213-91421(+)
MKPVLNSDNKSGIVNAIFLMTKAFIGTGVLFLCKAFANGGLLGSLMLLLVIAIFSMIGMWFLFKSSLGTPGTYQDIAGALYGKSFKTLVMASLVMCQSGFIMVYFLFVASNVQDLVSTLSNCKYEIDNKPVLITMQLIIYIPLVLIRRIQSLTKFAVLANILMLVGVVFVIYSSLVKLVTEPVNIKLFNNLSDTSLFLGTAIFTFEGFGLVIPISQSMKDPRQFNGVLISTIALVSALYLTIGAIGYSAYGVDTQTNILLNMPNNIPLKIVQFCYVIAVMLSFPLQLFPAIEILEMPFFSDKPNETYRSVYRAAITAVAALGAYLGANSLDVFTSFIGAFCGMPVGFIYPPMLYLRSCARTRLEKTFCCLYIVFGILATIFASSMAFHKLIYAEEEFQLSHC